MWIPLRSAKMNGASWDSSAGSGGRSGLRPRAAAASKRTARWTTSCRFVPPRTSVAGDRSAPGAAPAPSRRNGPRVSSTPCGAGVIWRLGASRTGRSVARVARSPVGRRPARRRRASRSDPNVDEPVLAPRPQSLRSGDGPFEETVRRSIRWRRLTGDGRHSADRPARLDPTSRGDDGEPAPSGSTTTRSKRNGSCGTAAPSGSDPRSSSPYAAARTRPACDGRPSPRAGRSRDSRASEPRRRRAPPADPGRPPRGRARGDRHGRSGPGRSSQLREARRDERLRRHHPPAGRRSPGSPGRSAMPASSQPAAYRRLIGRGRGLRPAPSTPATPGPAHRASRRRPSPA